MSRSLCLAGMMGSGKSTVGRVVADRLGRRFVDSDREIERWTGTSVADLFRVRGEAAFRDLEHEVVAELARFPDLVIALGGGALLRDDTVAALGLTGAIVLLDAPLDVLARRVARRPADRPLLAEALTSTGDVDHAALLERLSGLRDERDARYRDVADGVVDAGGPTAEVADRVVLWAVEAGDVLTPSEHEQVAA
jgi:shikimate kinase